MNPLLIVIIAFFILFAVKGFLHVNGYHIKNWKEFENDSKKNFITGVVVYCLGLIILFVGIHYHVTEKIILPAVSLFIIGLYKMIKEYKIIKGEGP